MMMMTTTMMMTMTTTITMMTMIMMIPKLIWLHSFTELLCKDSSHSSEQTQLVHLCWKETIIIYNTADCFKRITLHPNITLSRCLVSAQ